MSLTLSWSDGVLPRIYPPISKISRILLFFIFIYHCFTFSLEYYSVFRTKATKHAYSPSETVPAFSIHWQWVFTSQLFFPMFSGARVCKLDREGLSPPSCLFTSSQPSVNGSFGSVSTQSMRIPGLALWAWRCFTSSKSRLQDHVCFFHLKHLPAS